MPWVITNGKNYIFRNKENRIATTPNVNLALTYVDRKQADKNCMCLPKTMKHLNYASVFVEMAAPAPDAIIVPLNQNEQVNHEINDEYLSIDAFITQTSNFQEFVVQAVEQKPALIAALSNVDLEISDIEHAIEFSNCNVVGGYKWYKMLREARERRRKYKDALICIDILTTNHPMVAAKSDITKAYEGLKHRQYTPRVLTELTDYFSSECPGVSIG